MKSKTQPGRVRKGARRETKAYFPEDDLAAEELASKIAQEAFDGCAMKNRGAAKMLASTLAQGLAAVHRIRLRDKRGEAVPDELRAMASMLLMIHKTINTMGVEIDEEELEL